MKKVLSLIVSIAVGIVGFYLFFSGLSGIVGGSKAEHEEILKMSVSERAEHLKENCKEFAYEELARNPEKHKSELVVFKGKVTQVTNSALLVNVTYNSDEFYSYYTDTVYAQYKLKDELKILENDIITMYGEFLGEKEYTSVLGQKITVPNVIVYYAELNK